MKKLRNEKPELSKKSSFYITKYRYYELKNFCLQYPDWKKALEQVNGWESSSHEVSGIIRGSLPESSTERQAMIRAYNALLDYNDKDYSSYHAKRPMIVFDTDSVRLQSVIETNPKVVDKLYMRYNAERIAKEVGANTIGYVSKLGNKTVSECTAYMERKMNDYLS